MIRPTVAWVCRLSPRGLRQVGVVGALALVGGLPAWGQPTPELAAKVQAVFERSCAQCHGSQLARPKARFGFVTDLPRMAGDADYVVPGKPEDSPVYTTLVTTDEDELMPPPDSDAPPLSADEKESVRQWVLALAAEPPAVASATPQPEVSAADLPTAATPPPPRPSDDPAAALERPAFTLEILLARLHPVVVHFPIALLIAAFLAELYAIARRRPGMSEATLWCVALGALGSVAGVVTGWLDAPVAGYSNAAVFLHRWMAVSTLVLSFVAWGMVLAAQKRGGPWIWAARLALLGVAGLVGVTGHLGGVLVYGEDYLPF